MAEQKEEPTTQDAVVEPRAMLPVAPVSERVMIPIPRAVFNPPPLNTLPPPEAVP